MVHVETVQLVDAIRDLLATLGSFAIAPLWSLQRMGIKLTEEEKEAYIAVWRHIG